MVTYIIRPIRVSSETCRLLHQHARPTVSLLLLIHPSHEPFGFSKIPPARRAETFRSACTFKTHYRYNSTPVTFLDFHCLSAACESTRLHLLFSFHAALCSVMAGAAGRDCLQQINISTHVSGPCAHRSGWKLLQSFLRRRGDDA